MDRFDLRKPRTISSLPSVFFRHDDWDTEYNIFASDIRHEVGDVESWEFEVFGVKLKSSQLSFSNIERIPSEFAVYLINEGNGEATNLREDSVYNFTPVSDILKFSVVVGNDTRVDDQIKSVLPKEFVLGQNYPNPFNPMTTISVAIPLASDVELKVYDILGRAVNTIHTGHLEAGQYWFSWEGRDGDGNIAASGIYLFRLTTNNGVQLVGKMVLMR